MKRILVGTADREVYAQIRDCFSNDYRVDWAASPDMSIPAVGKTRYELVFLDLAFLGHPRSPENYRTALKRYKASFPAMDVIVLSPAESIRDAVVAVKAGAENYITTPVEAAELTLVVQSLLESLRMESELDYLRDQFWQDDSLEVVHTKSPVMREVFAKIRSVAPTKTTVLLNGETGTGKSVLARLLHRHSSRQDKQFIAVHCGAIADTLIESELFGHEKGAFTGAIRRKLGKFEIAHEGTLFLDEIGTVTPAAQIKLLHVIQERTLQRVGGETDIEVDVRIIAATNADLKQMTQEKLFREDLYYRLSVFPIEVPPLRARSEDIPLLSQTFLKRLNLYHGKEIESLHEEVAHAFSRYEWPGNIRELENLIERAYILESTDCLTPESFPQELFDNSTEASSPALDTSRSLAEVRRAGIEHLERQYVKEVLMLHRGKVNLAAETAGITPRQLHKLMTRYGIHKEEFKRPRKRS